MWHFRGLKKVCQKNFFLAFLNTIVNALRSKRSCLTEIVSFKRYFLTQFTFPSRFLSHNKVVILRGRGQKVAKKCHELLLEWPPTSEIKISCYTELQAKAYVSPLIYNTKILVKKRSKEVLTQLRIVDAKKSFQQFVDLLFGQSPGIKFHSTKINKKQKLQSVCR